MLTGKIVGMGVAQRPSGQGTDYQLIIPVKSTENLATIASEAKRWWTTVQEYDQLSGQGTLPREVYKRAKFAEEAMAVTGDNLRLGVCCLIVCQSLDGHILGVATWGWMNPQEGAINLQAIDPRHMAGTPGHDQYRGVGTALLAAVSRQILAAGGTALFLHPLDNKAAEFWHHRGFGACGGGGLMCIRGRSGIDTLIDGCKIRPDRPDGGEVIECGAPGATTRYRMPATAKH
ncbi:MAG: GNAT family N-acetyltransferase [Dehalococcoidia bacterium]|nr:GNAT family N-acetyltransferase [Dehalococcoidia bacterium]